MPTATDFSADTPAYIQFSQMESWLASSDALQLPLHQIESQQQAKGREVQRLLLQAHLHHRGNGDVGPALQFEQKDGTELSLANPGYIYYVQEQSPAGMITKEYHPYYDNKGTLAWE